MAQITLRNGRVVGDYKQPYFIAELNTSHFGDAEKAFAMIDAARTVGCDCVKFQSWSANSLYSSSYYKANPIARRMIDKFAFTPMMLKEMARYAQSVGVDFSSTPYSINEAVFLAEECDVPFIKIASMELNNHRFLREIAQLGVPVVLSTGMGTYDEVARALGVFEKACNPNVAVLHCTSVYPSPPEIIRLRNIGAMRDLFPSFPSGYSDHSLGSEIAVAAIALGACIIEKHLTLDQNRIGMDNQMATEPDGMSCMIQQCCNVWRAMGGPERILCEEEIGQIPKMRRSLTSTRTLEVGDILSYDDLTAKRPGDGIPPNEIDSAVGRRIRRRIEADSTIYQDDLD
ncbi:MAG: hypothetical protein RL594_799 [Bacteroidota bacterium]|jgi:N-acetylneuraminate synthase